MKRMALLAMVAVLLFSGQAAGKEKIKLYRTSSPLIYMRVTEVIYNDTIPVDGGRQKSAPRGNIFAQISVNFANLTDKPIHDYGLQPVNITVSPKNLILLGDNNKGYSGMSSTKLLKKELKPFVENTILKPGEDMVAAMCFLIPREVKITGVRYTFPGGQVLAIDYSDSSQIQP